jgi:poly(A) polymerase
MSFLSGRNKTLELINQVLAAIPPDVKAYLVGGAVRDLVLNQEIHDLDFVLVSSGRVIPIARKIANRLKAGFYPLDKERDTARLFLYTEDGSRLVLDFAALRDESLEQDLAARDFTMNAIAIDLSDRERLIDPLHGAKDIYQKVLRVCSAESLVDDPLRILRAVRLATQFDFKIEADTIQLIKQATPDLAKVSPERLRDEIFRLLDNTQVDTSLRIMQILGILPHIFPEISPLIGLRQTSPHTQDVWNHTLSVVQKLEQILFVLGLDSDLEETGNIVSSWISLRLGRYRQQFAEHFSKKLNPERTTRSLLSLAAIYHDVGKADTQSVDAQQRIHFYRHEQISQERVVQRARFLRLSGPEIDRLAAITGSHLRPLQLNQSAEIPTKRAIYKFWRDLDEAGVDVCLLSIADLMGTYGANLSSEALMSHLATIRALLDAWWEQRQTLVNPPSLVNGNQLMDELNLEAGPVIGQILEEIRQAQVEGSVTTAQQALEFAHNWIETFQGDA